jgi:hypothetical protein
VLWSHPEPPGSTNPSRYSELAKFASLPSSRMPGTLDVVFVGVPIDAGRPPIWGPPKRGERPDEGAGR